MILLVVVLVGALGFTLSRHRQLYRMTILPKFHLRVITPCAINDRGQIAGVSRGRFYLWERGKDWRELGRASKVFRINDAGQVSGSVIDPNGRTRAFLWDPNDGMIVLGADGSAGSTLNNRGQMVGLRSEDPNDPRLFVWDKTGAIRELNGMKGTMTAMNDAGQLVGFCVSQAPGYEVARDSLREPNGDHSVIETPLPSEIFRKLTNNGGSIIGIVAPNGRSQGARAVLLEPIPERWGK